MTGVPQHTAGVVAVRIMYRQGRRQCSSAQSFQRSDQREVAPGLVGGQGGRHHEPVRRPRPVRPHARCAAWLVSSCGETAFQIKQTWSCAAFSSSFSLATGPSQNRLQFVNYLSQLLLWLVACQPLWPSHCVHTFQTTSFFCRRSDTSHPPC